MADSFDFASLEQFIKSVLDEQRDLLNVGEIVDPTAVPGMDDSYLDGFFDPAQANELPWRNLDGGDLAQGRDLLNFEDVAASSWTSEKDPSNLEEFNALLPWEPLDLKGQTKLKWNGSSVIGSERRGTRLQNMDEVYSLVRECNDSFSWAKCMPLLLSGNKSPPAQLHQRTSTSAAADEGHHPVATPSHGALPPRQMGARSKEFHAGCGYCRKNGSTKANYMSHRVKDDNGRTTCPVLRSYSCKLCGATQDEAHTETRCHLYVPENHDTSIATLKATRYGATGKRQKKE